MPYLLLQRNLQIDCTKAKSASTQAALHMKPTPTYHQILVQKYSILSWNDFLWKNNKIYSFNTMTSSKSSQEAKHTEISAIYYFESFSQ